MKPRNPEKKKKKKKAEQEFEYDPEADYIVHEKYTKEELGKE